MLKLGNGNINKAYLGSTEIKKMYFGNDLVFDNSFSYEIEIVNAIARANLEGFTIPDAATLNALDGLIKRTKLNGNYWASRDVFSMFQFNNTLYGDWTKINLKDASKPLMTWHGGMSYGLLGIKGNEVNGYIDTKWSPSLSTNFTQSSMGITHGFENDFTPNNGRRMGIGNSSPIRRLALIVNHTSGDMVVFLNDFTSIFHNNILSKKTVSIVRSNDSRGVIVNGISQYYDVILISPIVTGTYYLSASNENGTATGFSDGTNTFFDAGGFISESEALQFKTDLNIYFSEIGTAQIT